MISSYLAKKHLLITLILTAVIFSTACISENDRIPDFTVSNTGPYMLNVNHLDLLKSRMDDPFIKAELSKLKLLADEALINDFEYVTDKANLPPSGDRNDYMSLARYLWPDPSTGDFTVVRDGITNPIIYQYDRPKLDRISTSIFFLSLAYFYFENEDYARKATELISNWFLEEDTKMNPNLNFAQVALGVNNNRGNHQGIIDTNDFIKVIDAASLIYDSRHWTTSKHKELKAWFYSFSRWIDSNYNADAFCDPSWCNNISTWIDAQKIIYFLFTEQEDRLNSSSSIQPIRKKIPLQFSPDGIQQAEESRTLFRHYFYFNLRGHIAIALMRKQRGDNDRDWSYYNSPDFGGIKPALDRIVRFLNGTDASGSFNQASDFDNCRYLEIFRPAAIIFDHQEYEDIANQLLYHQCSNLNITLTMPPLEWIGTEEPENSTLF